jgi:ubiquitin carboxyl-terminal hydrolase 5/13
VLNLDNYAGKGRQAGEAELDADAAPGNYFAVRSLMGAAELEYNAASMEMLEGMGFPIIRCQKALLATGNGDAETAMNWLFAHMDDAGESLITICAI